jgi:putative SOS response-associated peptidase YedK
VAQAQHFFSRHPAGGRWSNRGSPCDEWQDRGDAEADPRNSDTGTTGTRPVARHPKPAKQAYAIRMGDDAPFAFGGLWEAWRDPDVEADDPAA